VCEGGNQRTFDSGNNRISIKEKEVWLGVRFERLPKCDHCAFPNTST